MLTDSWTRRWLGSIKNLIWPYPLTFFIAIGMGFLLGYLSSRGNWFYALALAAAAPLTVVFSRRPFLGVILWLLIMPLSSALPNPELLYWTIHRILIPLTLILAILPRLIHNSKLPPLRLGIPEVCVLLLVAYIPLSLVVTDAIGREPMRKYLDRFVIPICIYLAVRLTTLDKRNLFLLEWTAFAVAIIQNGIGFLSWIMPSVLPRVWHHNIGYRTAGSLGDPAVFTSLLVFCAVILVNAAMQHKKGYVRLIFILVAGASFISVFISLSRGSWLAGLLVLLGLLVLYRKRMLRLILLGAIVMIILGAGFLSKHISMASERLADQGPIVGRLVAYNAMLRMFLEKPLLGWGYDTTNLYIRDYYPMGSTSFNFNLITSHNTYLTIITELGLVGFLLFILPMTSLLSKSVRAWRDPHRMKREESTLLAVFWLGALQNFLVSNFIDMRFFPVGLTLWWISLGLIGNLMNQYDESHDRYIAYKTRQRKQENLDLENIPFDPIGDNGG